MGFAEIMTVVYLVCAVLVCLYAYLVRSRLDVDEMEMLMVLGFVPVVGIVVAVFVSGCGAAGFFRGAFQYYRRRDGRKP